MFSHAIDDFKFKFKFIYYSDINNINSFTYLYYQSKLKQPNIKITIKLIEVHKGKLP
jgi:hypothetical protein